MKSTYRDPAEGEMKEILSRLSSTGDTEDIRAIINSVYPTWLVSVMREYSQDYPHLNGNWTVICGKNGSQKRGIVLVDEIVKDEEHLLINIFCERMTREGYMVRRRGEFVSCEVCNSAIPSLEVYSKMKMNFIKVPTVWSRTCTTCK